MGKKQPLTISFTCRPCRASTRTGLAPIEAWITVDGKRERITLPKKALPDEFQDLSKAADPNDINIFLNAFRARINDIQTTLYVQKEVITAARIVDVYQNGCLTRSYTLEDLRNDFKKQKTRENIQPHTWNKYNNVYEAFLKVTSHKGTDEVSSITNADILRYEASVRTSKADTTASKCLKQLKAFFAYAVAYNKIPSNPFAAMKIGHGRSEKNVDYLTYDEIQILKKTPLDSDRLCNVRIVFLWQCFTGQNYGDLRILKEGDVQYDEATGQYFIEKARYKKGRYGKEHIYRAVLFEDAVDIYKAYGERLPLISETHYREYLDEIIKAAKINKHITTKSGRKTYACYLVNYLNMYNYNVLKKMLGHENIRQTQEYCEVFKETVLSTTKKQFRTIKKTEIQENKKLQSDLAKEYAEILEGVDDHGVN